MEFRKRVRNLVVGLVCLLGGAPLFASVPPMIERVATEQGVPSQIFYAIVLAESRSPTQQGSRAWPWTINLQGHPHFFATREEAYSFASTLVEQGTKNFDVGIAQVNWYWHGERFDYNLWSAFDPYTNLTAAAQHLREQYARPECNTWELAVGCYHRPARGKSDLVIASAYADRVFKIWFDL